jgi:hypothetical protein
MQGEALSATMGARGERDRLTARFRVTDTFDELQDAIRHELGADVIQVDAGTRARGIRGR